VQTAVRRVDGGARRDGVTCEPVPVIRDEQGRIDPHREINGFGRIHVADDPPCLALGVTAVDR
jgi:hypothetical protein